MAFESTPQATGTGSRYLGEGFRHEPDFRDGTDPFELVSEPAAESDGDPTVVVSRRSASPNLEYVFDDPAHGEPGRDRMLVHGLWELLLALAVVGAGYLLHTVQPGALTGAGLRALALPAAVLGLAAAAAAVSLRAGVPNLAVGAVAVAAGAYYAQHAGGGGLTQVLLTVLGLCAAVGLVQGLVVVGLQVPAWATGLAAAAAVLVWPDRDTTFTTGTGSYDPHPHAYLWLGGFVVLSTVTGLVCLVPALRRASGRFRPVADPARRRGTVAALVAVTATVLSAVLAGLSGVLAVAVLGTATRGNGLDLTAMALGAALLGGTSAFGRRGGVFGTVFAVALVSVVTAYAQAKNYGWSALTVGAVAIGVGLVVTRLVERFGRPAPGRADDDEDWVPTVHAAPPADTRTWPPTAAPVAPAAGGLWDSDDAWGSGERR